MALLTKQIIPVNTYKVRSNQGRISKNFDIDYLSKVAATSNEMIAKGLNIPAPYDHNKEAAPKTGTEIEENKSATSFTNAGYWKHFWVAPDAKNNNTPTLFGTLEVDDDKAETIKKNNKEVSVSITSDFEDGLGRKWNDGLMHVAIVNHPVVPGQDPFKDAPDNVTVVNMSMLEPGGDDEAVIEEIKTVLPKVKISLPSSTNKSTFLRDLLVALKVLPEGSDSSLEPVPIYMSTGDPDMPLSEDQAKALVATNAIDPTTQKPFTMESLGFQVKKPTEPAGDATEILASIKAKDAKIETLIGVVSAFKNKFVEDTKASLERRKQALIAAGIVTKEWAKDNIDGKIEFQMSIAEGKVADHPLELVMSALETKIPASSTPPNGLPAGASLENFDLPGGDDVEMDDTIMNTALDALSKDGVL